MCLPNTTVAGVPAKIIERKKAENFTAYAVPLSEKPDPLLTLVEDMAQEIETLKKRIGDMEQHSLHSRPYHTMDADHVKEDHILEKTKE